MKTIKGLIPVIAGLLLLLSSCLLHAEGLPVEDPSYKELIEPLLKSKIKAFEKAKAERKYVFLFAGNDGCGNCKEVAQLISKGETSLLLKESYVSWYIDWHSVKNNPDPNTEGKNYVDEARAQGIKYLPALFIIKPETETEPETIIKFEWGKHPEEKMIAFFDIENRPVSNETITFDSNKTYISENTLFISNNLLNETITVYTTSGQVVASFKKQNTDEMVNTTNFPKGILIIKSSSGWSSKLLNR